MLKLTYTETGFRLERLKISLELWVAQRVSMTLCAGQTLYFEPSKASFLLPGKDSGFFRLEQILGAEHLTRHSAAVQWSFLSYLRDIETHLQIWESPLLLWVSRPWLSSIEQSAPEFWHWRTGVFEFEGEPTLSARHWEFGDKQELDEQFSSSKSGQSKVSNSSYPVTNSPIPNSPIPNSPSIRLNSKSIELADLVLAAASKELETKNQTPDGEYLQPLQTLQYIELLQENQCSSEALALAYQSLGNLYRDRIQTGDASRENLMIAIRALEQVIHYLEIDRHEQQNQPPTPECALLIDELKQNLTQYIQESNSLPPIAEVLNDLGTLYWMQSRVKPTYSEGHRTWDHTASDPVFCVEHSIALYRKGLNKKDGSVELQTRARLNKNLGSALADLARYQDKTQNLHQAVTAYQQALLDIDSTTEPQQYAAT